MHLLPTAFLLLLFLSYAPGGNCWGSTLQLSTRRTATPLHSEDTSSEAESDADWRVRVQAAESKVHRLNGLLTALERRSTQERLDWMRERTALAHKISVLRALLNDVTTPVPLEESTDNDTTADALLALELELEMAHESELELLQEEERLEREVLILQDQLVHIRNLLKTEQIRSAELEERLDIVLEEQERDRRNYQIQLEGQARERKAMMARLLFYEQQQQQYAMSNYGPVRNETVLLS